MAQDFTKLKLGPCKVTYDFGGASPVVIESTDGGVVLNLTLETFEVKTDQTGDTVVKEITRTTAASAEVPIAEYDLSNLQKMIPGSRLVTNATDATKKKVIVGGNAGIDLLTYAKKVKLEPLNGTANDAVTLLKAAPKPQIKHTFKHDQTRISNVTFVGYPDPSSTPTPNDMVIFGDESA